MKAANPLAGTHPAAIPAPGNIPARRQAEAYGEMGREILQILNEPESSEHCIQRVLAVLKMRTGFDCAGIRLQDGEDFPYFVQEGFSKNFLLKENSLLARGPDGAECRGKDGKPCLECTCGLVISGRTDPADPLSTPGGSYWTNNSSLILGFAPEEDPRLRPRNTCIHGGYASVALVPIRNQKEIVGLIQLNDRREGCFTLETIQILEGIAAHIGAALMRQRAEAALRDANWRLESIIVGTRVGTWEWNVQTGATIVNERSAEILGHTLAELAPVSIKTWETLAHPDDLKQATELLKRHFAGELDYYDYECRMRHKDGHWVWIHDRGRVVTRDEAGRPLMMFGTHTDITERKLAEAALRESHELFSLFIRHSPIYTYIKSVTQTESRVLQASDNFQEMIGGKGADMVGKTMAELFPAEFAAKITGDDWTVVTKGELLRSDEDLDGRNYSTIKFPIVQKGRTLLAGYSIDVTERKRAEEELARSREQLRALSLHIQSARETERTRISREIHDELGQMLTGLKMDLHLAEDLVTELHDVRLNPLLDKLVAATELADTTITTVQRIASELRPGALDRLGLVMALRYEAQQFEKHSGLACELTLPLEDPELSPEQATAFFRIFQEALTNVARHADARIVTAQFRTEPAWWILEVRDDGKGIAEDEVTRTRSLGLLGMQERARLHGGAVNITRSSGGGTVVEVELPRGIPPTPMTP